METNTYPIVRSMHTDWLSEDLKKKCPYLMKYTNPVRYSPRKIIGRDQEMLRLAAILSAPELCNACLIGEAGSGKTMLVQGVMEKDTDRSYLEINLAKMIADFSPVTLGNSLTQLFGEVDVFKRITDRELVLFVDEFHQIVQLSAPAVEAMKPLLADSGTRGVKVIAATTFDEFRQYILPNKPLVERFQRLNLGQPGREMVVAILKGMAKQYGVASHQYNNSLYEMIYEYTNRYIPSSSQPRKSIRILDAMVGWHNAAKRRLDVRLLADVIQQSEGINIAFKADATKIKKYLDDHVYAQSYATLSISNRMHIAVADLNDKSKPMSTFLFTGSTGVGKTEMAKQLAKILFRDSTDQYDQNQSSNRHFIRFDMSEYARPESVDHFRKEISARIWERPFSVVLLDEIEKASAEVTRELLQVIDDGRLSDENGRQVVFTNCYIIITTNAGSEIYKNLAAFTNDISGGRAEVLDKERAESEGLIQYIKLIKESITTTTADNKFPPELLGRIDCIVPFQPLSEDTKMRIIGNKMDNLIYEVLKKHNKKLKMSNKIPEFIVKDNLDRDPDQGGARAAVAKFEEQVVARVARCINENPNAIEINVRISGDMAFENKTQLKSAACIHVNAIYN
ncbi:hypothetical protein C804_03562 [Lachnospiraceae bacterium A4]|nr:hypothetical protein C804_03562 [Lachnospiraceae bacterium A4]